MRFSVIDRYSPRDLIKRVFSQLWDILRDLQGEYPFFKQWFERVHAELENSESRSLIICSGRNIGEIIGVAILKKTEQERKICTLRVVDKYKRQGIGTVLLMDSMRILQDDKPLITVSGLHMKEYAPFLKKHGFVLKDKVKSIYKRGSYEYFFNVPYQHRIVLLSIKPQYAEKIAQGLKKVEFRKKVFVDSVDTVYVYSSSPVKKIIGYFNKTSIVEATPDKLWEDFSQVGLISKTDFQNYYKMHEVGYGIEIKKFIHFAEPIDPKDYDPKFRAPQSYCYIDNVEEIDWLKRQPCK